MMGKRGDRPQERSEMQITIEYRLSDKGRRAALAAGVVAPELVRVSGDVLPDTVARLARESWLLVREDGTVYAAGSGGLDDYFPSAAELLTALDARRVASEEQARERAAKDAAYRAELAALAAAREAKQEAAYAHERAEDDLAIAAFLADLTARASEWGRELRIIGSPAVVVHSHHPRWDEVRAEAARRNEAAAAARLVEEEARAAAKLAYLSQWIKDHGTEDMRERQAETAETGTALGLVPEDEVIDAIRDSVLPSFEQFAQYERIVASDLDGDPDNDDDENYGGEYAHDDARFETTPATTVPPEQWAMMKRLRAASPEGASVTLRVHTCTCRADGCRRSHSIARYGILVRVTVTPGLSLSREYAAEPQQ